MDSTDYAIYRHLSQDGLVRIWASRRLVDPRVSVREIADAVGLSEAGVRSRLQGLKTRGLLRGTEVSLNPSLFGASVMTTEVPIRDTRESEQLLQDLSTVDGVLFARDILEEASRPVNVFHIADTPSATARRSALLRRLSPTRTIRGPSPYWIPESTRSPTPLEWRLLAAFRKNPDATLGQFAERVGVSLKTAARRYGLLIDSHACWWSHSSDSEEWPLALLLIRLRRGTEAAAVSDQLSRRLDSWLPVAADGLGVDPRLPDLPLCGLIPAERPVALERAIRGVLGIYGVEGVRRTFGLGSKTYPEWIDEQLASTLARVR